MFLLPCLGLAEILPEGVEHVFFRSKADIHTTRSRWLVGLVLDFDLYEKHLVYVNHTLQQAHVISQDARNYFESLRRDPIFRTNAYKTADTKLDSRESLKVEYYDRIIKSQSKQLVALQKLHDKNYIDFNEIKGIGQSELEESRKLNRQQNPSRRKRFLSLAAGIFSGIAYYETQRLKGEVDELRNNQQVIRHVLSESLSLINITRMEVEENRHAINKIINQMNMLVESWQTAHAAYVRRIAPLQRFVIAHAQIQTNLDTVRNLITAETDMITDLHAKVSKLSTQQLSPNLLPAPELVRILKSIEVELPPQLILPRDPRAKPWYYYTILKTSTMALERQLVITVEIPLLDVTQKFHVKEAISLPVPYHKTNITVEYELEFKNFAISTDGRQYVIFTLEDQINCGKPDINFCAMTSAVYETNHHRYCTLALFQKDLRKIEQLCKIRVTNKLKLPLARYISNGKWLVATNQPFYLRKLCVKSKHEKRITVTPPFNIITLESGCRALADKLELPIYFEGRSEHQIDRETRITTTIKQNITNLPIWTPLEKQHLDVKFDLEKLPPIDSKPIDEFVNMLEEIEYKGKYRFSWSNLPYIIIAVVVLLLVIIIGIVCLKRHLLMGVVTKKVMESLSANKTRQETNKAKTVPTPPNPTSQDIEDSDSDYSPTETCATSAPKSENRARGLAHNSNDKLTCAQNTPVITIDSAQRVADVAINRPVSELFGLKVTGASPRADKTRRNRTTLVMSRRTRR